jgi:hypothetical protein
MYLLFAKPWNVVTNLKLHVNNTTSTNMTSSFLNLMNSYSFEIIHSNPPHTNLTLQKLELLEKHNETQMHHAKFQWHTSEAKHHM